jgi:hypothetical protein
MVPALLAALALLVAAPAAVAQTATAASGPPADATQEVKDVYSDFGSGANIDPCDHERSDLQKALDTVDSDFESDYPEFRGTVKAAIEQHDAGRCGGDESPSPTPSRTATATPTPTPDSGRLPSDDNSPESGALPPPDDSSGTTAPEDGTLPPEDGTLPPEDGTLPPEDRTTPEGAPAAPAPVPTVVPAAPAVTPTPSATPIVLTSSHDGGLLVPGILIALALFGAAALALLPVFARRNPRLEHAWREAAYRTRATWTDFTDWLRLGR